MDLKKLNKDQAELISFLTLLGGAGIVMVFVILPMMHRVGDLRSQSRLMAEELDLVRNFARTNGSSLAGGPLISSNEAALALEEITILGNKYDISFLSMVRQDKTNPASKKSRISKTSKTSKTLSAPNLFNTLPVQLETRSTYKQLGSFLGELKDLRQSIILVDNFQIIQDKREPNKVS